jgi:hypothetical protein
MQDVLIASAARQEERIAQLETELAAARRQVERYRRMRR